MIMRENNSTAEKLYVCLYCSFEKLHAKKKGMHANALHLMLLHVLKSTIYCNFNITINLCVSEEFTSTWMFW